MSESCPCPAGYFILNNKKRFTGKTENFSYNIYVLRQLTLEDCPLGLGGAQIIRHELSNDFGQLERIFLSD